MVNVLGVDIACVEKKQLLATVTQWIEQDRPASLSYVNAHCLNTAQRDPAYCAILNKLDLVYADGVGVTLASRLLGGYTLTKITGADWIGDFCQLAERGHWRTYILAGKPGVARQAAANLLHKYPALEIVGARDGYFAELPEDETIADIVQKKPDILFVGMGVPQQEKWIDANGIHFPRTVCWSVGALFDYVAGIEPRCPLWLRNLALEWFWRLLVNPRGKWARYILGNPLFVYRLLRQKMNSKGEKE